MKFNGKFVWEDYLQAQLLHVQQPVWIRVLSYLFYALVGFILLWGLLSSISGITLLLYLMPVLFLAAFFPLYRFVLLPRQARRIFDQSKELALPIDYEVTEAGLKISNAMGSSLRPWKNFHKWKEGKDMLLLYLSDLGFLMIPKHFFSDSQQLEAIKKYLLENEVKPARTRSWWVGVLIFLLMMVAVVVAIYISSASGGR